MNSVGTYTKRQNLIILIGLGVSMIVIVLSLWLNFSIFFAILPFFGGMFGAAIPTMFQGEKTAKDIAAWLTAGSWKEDTQPILMPPNYLVPQGEMRTRSFRGVSSTRGFLDPSGRFSMRQQQFLDQEGKPLTIPVYYLAFVAKTNFEGWALLYPQNGRELDVDISLESREFNSQVRVWASDRSLPYKLFYPDLMAWYMDLPEQPWIYLQPGCIFLGFPINVSLAQVQTLVTSGQQLETWLRQNHLIQ